MKMKEETKIRTEYGKALSTSIPSFRISRNLFKDSSRIIFHRSFKNNLRIRPLKLFKKPFNSRANILKEIIAEHSEFIKFHFINSYGLIFEFITLGYREIG